MTPRNIALSVVLALGGCGGGEDYTSSSTSTAGQQRAVDYFLSGSSSKTTSGPQPEPQAEPLQIEPLSPARALFADAYELQSEGKLEEAASKYEEGLRIEPGNGLAHFMLGGVYAKLGRTDDARLSFVNAQVWAENDEQRQAARAQVDALVEPAAATSDAPEANRSTDSAEGASDIQPIVWPDGTRYHGQGREGIPHGQGTMVWPSGNRYEGEWRDGQRTGYGKMILASGNRYEGEFRDNKYEGRGSYTWASGDRFEGEFRDGLPNGPGTATYVKSGNVYSGHWTNGCYNQDGRRAWTTSKEECGF